MAIPKQKSYLFNKLHFKTRRNAKSPLSNEWAFALYNENTNIPAYILYLLHSTTLPQGLASGSGAA
jgi:hypothetical protein